VGKLPAPPASFPADLQPPIEGRTLALAQIELGPTMAASPHAVLPAPAARPAPAPAPAAAPAPAPPRARVGFNWMPLLALLVLLGGAAALHLLAPDVTHRIWRRGEKLLGRASRAPVPVPVVAPPDAPAPVAVPSPPDAAPPELAAAPPPDAAPAAAEVAAPPPPAARKPDERLILVRITSSPARARVRNSNRTLGATPLVLPLRTGEQLDLTLSKRGYLAATRRLVVGTNREQHLNVDLTRPARRARGRR
jgi:hypothetical protein